MLPIGGPLLARPYLTSLLTPGLPQARPRPHLTSLLSCTVLSPSLLPDRPCPTSLLLLPLLLLTSTSLTSSLLRLTSPRPFRSV